MKKSVSTSTKQQRLRVQVEKLRKLTDQQLDQVAGGLPTDHCPASRPCNGGS